MADPGEIDVEKLLKKFEDSRELNLMYGQTIQVMLNALRIYANPDMWVEDENGKRTFFGDGETDGWIYAHQVLTEIGAIKEETSE